MVASVISISPDSSEESVGSHAPRVILFSVIPAIIPVIPEVSIVLVDPLAAPEVGAVSVTSPAGVLDLVDYLSSASDPSEDSLPPAPELPLVSPFLCSDDSEVDRSHLDHPYRQDHHLMTHLHHHLSFPLLLPYRTHLNGPHKFSTARKRVGPFPARRLAWRRVSYRSSDFHSSPDFTLDSSSSGSSSDSLSDSSSSGSPSDSFSDTSSVHSSGFDASSQIHSGPSTRVASSKSSLDSSSERLLDSSSLSAGPSHKRCRSPTTSVPSSTPIATADTEVVVDLGIGDGVGAHTEDGIGIGVEIATSDIREDEEEFEAEASAGGTIEIVVDPLVTGGISESTRRDVPDLEDTIYYIVHYMSEVPLDRITEFETAQRQLEDMTITRSEMTPEAIEELIAQRVAKALANYEETRAANALEAESQSQNGSDGDNGNGGNGNGGN
ncbi:hypothetical protein Tco_0745851 [Tanacetum coccineum]